MIPKRICGANLYMTAPNHWDESKDGSCSGLAVRKIGDNIYQSAWEPTPAELKLLNAGGLVIISILGGQPPIALSVEYEGDIEIEGE